MALTDNLVSYWALDEASGNAADSHGSNTLTNNNTVTFATGLINNGADLERSSSHYFSIADGSQTGLDITGDISISMRVKLEQLPSSAGGDFALVDKLKWAAPRLGYSLSADNANNLQFFVYNAASSLSRYSVSSFFGAPDVGSWVHIVIEWTAASPSTMRVYKNNVSQTVTTVSSSASAIGGTAVAFELGRYNGGNHFDGMIDEVGIWSRALTGTEVGELYNGGAGLAYPFTSAVTSNNLMTLGVGV